nr:hypothetical protein [Candidatus Njordarchaeota archaeon]
MKRGKRARNVRCIDCQSLDVGLNADTDMWIHCGAKHAQDIYRAAQEGIMVHAQERVTKAKAMMVRDCPHFAQTDEARTYEDLLEIERIVRENPRFVKENIKSRNELIKILRKKGAGVEFV